MCRSMLPRMRLVACILIPFLVLAGTYRLVRVSFPGAGEAETSGDYFSEEEQIGQIIDAFKIYAQAFDNRFPEVERIYGDELMRAVREKLKVPAWAGRSPSAGFGRLTVLQRTDPTFGYRGSGAKLADANRVLVHWSTADGMSQVIFCDLSHRKVDGRELSVLLSPWQTLADQCVVRVGSGGSGTVVTAKGLIVTANHGLPLNCASIDVRFADGRIIAAEVVSRSKRFDVAVLKIPVDQPIPFVRLKERRVANDEPAWLIGYGGGRSQPWIREVRTVTYVLGELLTTWNKVIGGDCGGPVLDANGCLIGVIVQPAQFRPTTCITISAPTLMEVFPVLTVASDAAAVKE